MKIWPVAFAAVLLAGPVVAENAATKSSPPSMPPSKMTGSQIAQHNKLLERRDPNYITCRREDVSGSLAKKLRVCRTNQQWAFYSDQGSRNAQEAYDSVGRVAPQGN